MDVDGYKDITTRAVNVTSCRCIYGLTNKELYIYQRNVLCSVMISLLSVDVFQVCLCGRYRRISSILSSCFWIRDRGTVFSFWYFYLTFDARSRRLLFSVCQCFTLKAQGYICKWLKMYLHLSIRPKSRAIEFRIELLVIYGGIFKSWRIVFSAIFHRLWSDTFFLCGISN